jgi:PAS domain S-box-containing protein
MEISHMIDETNRVIRQKTPTKDLQASEMRYRRLFESARDGILILDATTRKITDANPFMVELLGYSRDEFLGKELWEIGLLKDQEASRAAFRELQENGYIRYEGLPLETKAGARRELEFISNVYAEDDHQVIQCNIRDITKRKRAEEALCESEERYRIVAENAADVIITIDQESTIVFVNESVERVFGYTVTELLGKPLTVLMPEYLRHLHDVGLGRYVQTGQKHLNWQSIEIPGLHKSGREVPLEISFGEYKRNGKHLFTGIARDITERKQSEEALVASEAALRQLSERQAAILDALPAHVCLLDSHGNILEVNATWKRFATANNYSGNNFGVGSNYIEICTSAYGECAEGAQQAADGIRAVLSGKLNNFELEYPCHSPEEKRWFRFMIAPLKKDPSEGLVVLHVNVTERKAAEDELIKLTGNLKLAALEHQQVLDKSLDVICQIDEVGRFIKVSAAAKTVWGYEPEELIGRMYMELVHPDDRAKTAQAAIDIMSGQSTNT